MHASHLLRSALSTLALLVVCFSLVACESKITDENFEKIQTGMSKSEVERLLGGAGEDESATGGTSITGAGITDSRKVKDVIVRWKDGPSKYIVVTFRDGKVFTKTQGGLK